MNTYQFIKFQCDKMTSLREPPMLRTTLPIIPSSGNAIPRVEVQPITDPKLDKEPIKISIHARPGVELEQEYEILIIDMLVKHRIIRKTGGSVITATDTEVWDVFHKKSGDLRSLNATIDHFGKICRKGLNQTQWIEFAEQLVNCYPLFNIVDVRDIINDLSMKTASRVLNHMLDLFNILIITLNEGDSS